MKPIVTALVSLALLAAPAIASAQSVQTRSGALAGTTEGDAVVFKGVPFAAPPVGPLRWRPPQPYSWKGVLNADHFQLPCLQSTPADGGVNGGGVSGPSSEDCLYLNIWAPKNAKNAPVMLWIFGGGGVMGSGQVATYNGEKFARDGVILITINYRLGALAGFAHPALVAEANRRHEPFGNYHLLDSMAALKWVKDNIAAFGGDPGNVTVFGESAGATITANLVASPMAKGLFDKAIIESTGSLPTPDTTLERAEAIGAEAATSWGLNGEATTAAQLRALPADKVIAGQYGGGLRTIDDGQIMPHSIMETFQAGGENDVPMIIGSNSDEGRLAGTQAVATYAMSGAPAWQYFFDYVPQARRAELPNGVPHAGEISFVFATVRDDRRGGDKMTDADVAAAERMHSCWVAFAKAPIGTTVLGCADGFQWPARTDGENRPVAVFQDYPKLLSADQIRTPPNGAAPGRSSRP